PMFYEKIATAIILEKIQKLNKKKLFLINKVKKRMRKQSDLITMSSRSIPHPPRTGTTDTKGAGDRR
ncbi:MAG: hypothetical protein SAK29_06730, partial [Scytonema sp. PMC 1069.18]|nr:hypothetical protein [Scytonema sp. PMC 1069.18]